MKPLFSLFYPALGRIGPAAILAATAIPAAAFDYSCTYETYCGEKRSCGPTTLELSLTAKKGTPDAFVMATGGREIAVREVVDPSREARAYVSDMEFNMIHLVSIFKDGTSRYTAHTPVFEAHSQTFHGTCEVK